MPVLRLGLTQPMSECTTLRSGQLGDYPQSELERASAPMKLTFEGVWADFRYRLKPRTQIKMWSAHSDYTGAGFKVDGFDPTAITVIPEGRKPRSISREDFRRVYAQWGAYKAGKIGRAELGEITRSQNTSYILSLLHWLEASDG
jgi:hypothetical protein